MLAVTHKRIFWFGKVCTALQLKYTLPLVRECSVIPVLLVQWENWDRWVISGNLEFSEKLDSPFRRKRSATKMSERRKDVWHLTGRGWREFCPVRNHGLLTPLIASAVPEVAMIWNNTDNTSLPYRINLRIIYVLYYWVLFPWIYKPPLRIVPVLILIY
jgi:hypothetical protein